MNKSWNQWYTKCPFYRTDDGKEIIECEGVTDASRLDWRFLNRVDFSIQMETFCKGRYQNCEVYRMLMGIYDESEDK